MKYFEEGLRVSKRLYADNYDSILVVIALYEIASLHFEMNFYNTAFKTAIEAQEICKRIIFERNSPNFMILSLIVRIMFKLKDFDNANDRLNDLINMHRNYKYNDPFECANHKLNYIAKNLLYLGYRQKEALDYALEALRIYEQNLPSGDFAFVDILLNIAKFYKECDDIVNSEKYLNKTLQLLISITLPGNSLELVFLYDQIGILLHSFGRYDEAISYLKKYYVIMKEKRLKSATVAFRYLWDCFAEKK